MKNNILVYAAIVTASIFWGMSYLSAKVALSALTPLALIFSRFLIGLAVLFIILKIKEKEVKILKKDIPRVACAGLTGVALYAFFENNGIKLISASSASMIIASIPIFSLIGERIIHKNKFTVKKMISVVLSVLGVFLIITGNMSGSEFSGHIIGYIFMFFAALSWVTYNFITKPLYENYSGLTITFFQLLFGTAALAPFAIFHFPSGAVLSKTIVLNVLYLGIFCSAIAYFLYVFALNQLGVTTTTLFVNFLPVVTVISSFFILHERITLLQIIGGAIVIFAVCVITLEKRDSEHVILEE